MSRPKQSTLIIPPGDDPGGDTPFERFDNIMKRILSTPKKEVDEKAAEWRRNKPKKAGNGRKVARKTEAH